MFASIIGCSDFIGNLGFKKNIKGLLHGEILMGTAFTIIMYTIFNYILNGNASFFGIIGLFLSETLGGIILGVIFGMICVKMI